MTITQIETVRTLTKLDFQNLIDEIGEKGKLKSISSVLQHFGIKSNNSSCRKIVSTKIKEYEIKLGHASSHTTLYSLDDLKKAIDGAKCYSDVCKALEISVCTFNFKRIQCLCKENNISLNHFDIKATFRRNKFEWTQENIFCKNSKIARSSLRKVCKRFGYYTGTCVECGVGEYWQNKSLTLELDHVNGVSDDNRLENLRWLCPNCHSQTPTYRRRSSCR